jgi:hypothetical protein
VKRISVMEVGEGDFVYKNETIPVDESQMGGRGGGALIFPTARFLGSTQRSQRMLLVLSFLIGSPVRRPETWKMGFRNCSPIGEGWRWVVYTIGEVIRKLISGTVN